MYKKQIVKGFLFSFNDVIFTHGTWEFAAEKKRAKWRILTKNFKLFQELRQNLLGSLPRKSIFRLVLFRKMLQVCLEITFDVLQENYDNVSKGKYTVGLGQSRMAFVGDREDAVSMSLTGRDDQNWFICSCSIIAATIRHSHHQDRKNRRWNRKPSRQSKIHKILHYGFISKREHGY